MSAGRSAPPAAPCAAAARRGPVSRASLAPSALEPTSTRAATPAAPRRVLLEPSGAGAWRRRGGRAARRPALRTSCESCVREQERAMWLAGAEVGGGRGGAHVERAQLRLLQLHFVHVALRGPLHCRLQLAKVPEAKQASPQRVAARARAHEHGVSLRRRAGGAQKVSVSGGGARGADAGKGAPALLRSPGAPAATAARRHAGRCACTRGGAVAARAAARRPRRGGRAAGAAPRSARAPSPARAPPARRPAAPPAPPRRAAGTPPRAAMPRQAPPRPPPRRTRAAPTRAARAAARGHGRQGPLGPAARAAATAAAGAAAPVGARAPAQGSRRAASSRADGWV